MADKKKAEANTKRKATLAAKKAAKNAVPEVSVQQNQNQISSPIIDSVPALTQVSDLSVPTPASTSASNFQTPSPATNYQNPASTSNFQTPSPVTNFQTPLPATNFQNQASNSSLFSRVPPSNTTSFSNFQFSQSPFSSLPPTFQNSASVTTSNSIFQTPPSAFSKLASNSPFQNTASSSNFNFSQSPFSSLPPAFRNSASVTTSNSIFQTPSSNLSSISPVIATVSSSLSQAPSTTSQTSSPPFEALLKAVDSVSPQPLTKVVPAEVSSNVARKRSNNPIVDDNYENPNKTTSSKRQKAIETIKNQNPGNDIIFTAIEIETSPELLQLYDERAFDFANTAHKEATKEANKGIGLAEVESKLFAIFNLSYYNKYYKDILKLLGLTTKVPEPDILRNERLRHLFVKAFCNDYCKKYFPDFEVESY